MTEKSVVIKNKRASFDYEISERFTAGMQLTGTEVKSLRHGKASLPESFCVFKKGELYIKNMHIAEYTQGNIYNHEPMRERKLLLNKKELEKLHSKVKERGYTIIPVKVFFNERGYAKVEIGLARGKKHHDKRQSIKEKDMKREVQKQLKWR